MNDFEFNMGTTNGESEEEKARRKREMLKKAKRELKPEEKNRDSGIKTLIKDLEEEARQQRSN